MLFDEGDDKMVKTEAFPTIRMKIDRLLKITNEYQFNDLVKAVYCINLCINNRSVLESCLALNACLIEYEEKGSKRIGTYDEFKGFFGKIYDVMKPGIADDYTVEDFGEVQLRYNDKFYRVIIGTGHNNVYACLNFLPTLARNISREEELCLALEYVSGTIDYFIEENKNDGVVEKRFVLPTEILFYKVQKFFKEEVKKYDILELDSLMMSEGTTIEKSHFVCREDNIYPLYNVSLLIDLYDIWENKIDFKEQISVANEGIIDRIYSLFEMDRSRSCSIFAPAMIFPEQKYDSSQRTYTFIAKASRGVVVALNADEYEEGQLEKEIANIEKYHKSGTLHIAETFNRFDKSGLRGIHIPADMPIEYLIYDSFMNPNQMHMSLGEEGKKRKTCTALDVIYYLNFMDDIDELFEYLSYSNEKDYESSFGFGSDAALYFTWKNQDRYIAKGAIIFNMVDVGYDTENEAVVDYFKEELKDYPFHMRDYLFREPFSWKIEKRDFDTYEYTVKHGMGFGGIYLPLPQKNYVFLTNNVEFYKDVKDFGEYRQWIQLLEEIITEGFDSIKCVFEDNKAISNTGIQIAFMPIEYAVHAGHESFLYEDRIYVYSDAQYYSHKWIIRYVVKDINRIYEDIQEAKNRSTEFNILREILIPLLDRMPDLNELFESKRKKVSLEKKKVGVFSASVEYKWDNNVQNFSPEDYHYHEVRKRIANVCYGNMIKPGIYRGQEANQIIRAMQKAIIEDFEGEVSKYSWSELHYSLLDYHSTLLHDIDINWKRYGSYSGLDEKKDKEVRDRIIDQREKAKHDDRNTLYLIETNLYLHCESETLATIDDINLLLAYANWLVVLNDVADMCHFADNADVYSIRKHEIFAQYIEKLKQNNREYLETVLDTVTDFMIHSDNYDEISITDLEKTGITSGDIRKTVNSGILLSKKLVFHEGTIARNEKEVVYFVFDEMRDYCLARQILLNNISAYNVDGESVIEKLKQLKATGASCTEGVIHYCYVFFKTDELVSKLGQTEKMCNSILDLYRIPEGGERKSYWSMRYREELQNLGLRIILTSGLELTDFEITYIQDCLRKDPYEDGGMFFDTMLDGTLYGGIYNLDIYLGILFGLKNKDAILNTFHTISARNNMDDRFIPEDFIKYYNELSDSERKLQIQKIAELFLLCFKLHDKDKQEELEDFFYNLPTHDKVQNDMILEMRIACGLEVKDYE